MEDRRYDIYTTFHKLLRARLFEASLRFGRTDFGAASDEARETLAYARETLAELVAHAEMEDAVLHPVLREHGAAVLRELDAAHRSFDVTMATLEDMIAEIGAGSPPARARIAPRLYAIWNAFVGDQVLHMAREERDANAALWAHLDDGELEGIHQRILARVPPAHMARQLEQLLPLISLPERASMLRRAREGAPPHVVAGMREIGARALGAQAWGEVERAAVV